MKVLRALLPSAINVGLRGSALVSRLLLTLFVAKYMSLESVGQFGLLAAAVAILPGVIGFGFNYHHSRDLVGLSADLAAHRIRDRLLLTVAAFGGLLSLAGLASIAGLGVLPSNLPLVASIGLAEVVAFDLHYGLVARRKPVLANVLLFVRTGAWTYPYMLIGMAYPAARTLDVLLWFWLVGLVLVFVISVVRGRARVANRLLWHPVDSRWILRVLRQSKLIYLSDMAIVGFTFVDRFVVSSLLGITQVGVFVFYWSLANGIQVLIGAAVIQVYFPRLVDCAGHGDAGDQKRVFLELCKKVTVLAGVLSGAVWLATIALIHHLGRAELTQSVFLLAPMLLAVMVRCLSEVASTMLHARRQDRSWVLSNIAGLLVAVFSTMAFTAAWGLYGAGVAMICSSLMTFSMRLYGLRGLINPRHFAEAGR